MGSGWKIEKRLDKLRPLSGFFTLAKIHIIFQDSDYVFYMHNFKKRPRSNSRKVRLCLFTMLFVAVLSDYI